MGVRGSISIVKRSSSTRDRPERPLDVLLEVASRRSPQVDRDRAGLDLREVEDVVDELQEVVAEEWIIFA
jgi:hypothetical protein